MDLVGQRLGKYQIEAEIGRGGMGAVYRAYHPDLDLRVALKVLAPHLVWESEFVERFLREARSAARLKHPNIVAIHDVGQEQGTYYFVMEYVEGEDLKTLLKRRKGLPVEQVLAILKQLAAGLDYAHRQGLVHRDVKPANVIVGKDGHVTLTDFGIVKAAYETKLTATGTTLGTPEYMAPEQVMAQPVGPATDLYALAIIAYEMLSGSPPFEADTTPAVLHMQAYEPVPPIRQRRGDLPAGVEEVLARALAKAPAERYPSGAALVEALERALLAQAPRLEERLAEAEGLERAERWNEAAALYGQLLPQARTPQEREHLAVAQVRCQQEAALATLYDRGAMALRAGQWPEARQALAEVVRQRPEYFRQGRTAASLLAQALEGRAEAAAPVDALQTRPARAGWGQGFKTQPARSGPGVGVAGVEATKVLEDREEGAAQSPVKGTRRSGAVSPILGVLGILAGLMTGGMGLALHTDEAVVFGLFLIAAGIGLVLPVRG